jgi:hypothetical protein
VTAIKLAEDESNERLAEVMIRLEERRDVKMNPLAVLATDGPHPHVLLTFPSGRRVDLTPQEADLAAILLRMERPYPDYEVVARRFEHAADLAMMALDNSLRGADRQHTGFAA